MTKVRYCSQESIRLAVFIALAVILAILCSPGCYASTNDSVPALVQSLSDLPPDNSVLDLPEGVYTIGSTCTISRAGITIRGAGIGKTVLMRDPQFNGVMVKMDGQNSTITNLTLDGNGTATVISLNRRGIVADTIEVKNFTHIGVTVPASDCRVTNCVITGLGDPTIQSMGVWHDAGSASTNATFTIDHSTITDNGINGIYCTGGQVTITNNQLSRNHSAINPGGGQIDIGNAFTTNTVAVISGNTIADGGGIKAGGIEMGGGSFTVTNNTVRNHGGGGIGIGHNTIRARIAGNTVSDSGHYFADKNKPPCRSAIYIMYGARNVEISGNRCFDDQQNKTQTWGVILQGPPVRADPRFATTAIQHVVVTNNDLRGNIYPKGLLDESNTRDRIISKNFPPQANR